MPVVSEVSCGLDVRTANGSIRVLRGDGDETIVTAHLRCRTQERLDAAEVVVERGTDQVLNVYVDWPGEGRRGSEGCNFEIVLPEVAGVTLKSSNGGLYCENLGGDAMLTTSNGGVEVIGQSGRVAVHTSNGRIVVRNVNGECNLKTSNGAIKAYGVNNPISAQSSNGRIFMELGPGFSGEMRVSTSNGSLDINELSDAVLLSSSRNQLQFRIGESGASSSASTSNGGIRIRSAD
ncbi:MAG: hypothetical protein JXR25_15830 [Pontiellaceae bacterium]|nr:hypothetical protein [Pontiellaceae bacterium]MBN2786291.1 hypothetical protein [Pontiellaceae bacterium]